MYTVSSNGYPISEVLCLLRYLAFLTFHTFLVAVLPIKYNHSITIGMIYGLDPSKLPTCLGFQQFIKLLVKGGTFFHVTVKPTYKRKRKTVSALVPNAIFQRVACIALFFFFLSLVLRQPHKSSFIALLFLRHLTSSIYQFLH